jgi:hypothetical protein
VNGPVTNTAFNNNTVYLTGDCSQGISCGSVCGDDIIIVKNTVAVASWKGAYFSGSILPLGVDYDRFREIGSGSGFHCQLSAVGNCPGLPNGMAHGTDPPFVDPANWDLHLRCSDPISVAIDSGTALGYVSDYDGVSIPQDGNHDATFAPDIGAYEMSCPPPSLVVLNPVDDAYVAGDNVGANFGQTVDLVSDGSPLRESYMKFNLQSLAGANITLARVRMFVTNGSGGVQSLRPVSDNGWVEGTLTYANRPAKGATITTFTPGVPGVWREVDITAHVAANAGSSMSLAIDAISSDGYAFNSAEATSNRVELVIQWAGGSSCSTTADCDGDGWSTAAEGIIGTDPLDVCADNTADDAWPPDVNNVMFVDVIGDISIVASHFGQAVPPATARYNIAPDLPDSVIDIIGDISQMAGLFGQSCS